jgi:hypothetical protein
MTAQRSQAQTQDPRVLIEQAIAFHGSVNAAAIALARDGVQPPSASDEPAQRGRAAAHLPRVRLRRSGEALGGRDGRSVDVASRRAPVNSAGVCGVHRCAVA